MRQGQQGFSTCFHCQPLGYWSARPKGKFPRSCLRPAGKSTIQAGVDTSAVEVPPDVPGEVSGPCLKSQVATLQKRDEVFIF